MVCSTKFILNIGRNFDRSLLVRLEATSGNSANLFYPKSLSNRRLHRNHALNRPNNVKNEQWIDSDTESFLVNGTNLRLITIRFNAARKMARHFPQPSSCRTFIADSKMSQWNRPIIKKISGKNVTEKKSFYRCNFLLNSLFGGGEERSGACVYVCVYECVSMIFWKVEKFIHWLTQLALTTSNGALWLFSLSFWHGYGGHWKTRATFESMRTLLHYNRAPHSFSKGSKGQTCCKTTINIIINRMISPPLFHMYKRSLYL